MRLFKILHVKKGMLSLPMHNLQLFHGHKVWKRITFAAFTRKAFGEMGPILQWLDKGIQWSVIKMKPITATCHTQIRLKLCRESIIHANLLHRVTQWCKTSIWIFSNMIRPSYLNHGTQYVNLQQLVHTSIISLPWQMWHQHYMMINYHENSDCWPSLWQGCHLGSFTTQEGQWF